jgi:hypothetical protein
MVIAGSQILSQTFKPDNIKSGFQLFVTGDDDGFL